MEKSILLADCLRCPFDGEELINKNEAIYCRKCSYIFPLVDIGTKNQVIDFRGVGNATNISLTFAIPEGVLKSGEVEQFGAATKANFQCLSREKIRKLYGTKLQKEVLYYIDLLFNEVGKTAKILDLGCGSGGNKKYLESVGFNNIVAVDYMALGAEYLVDVHRLPFADESFDMVLTTATLEHFYNPYVAFKEIARVLNSKGMLIASGSFWEKWHGNSCFHFTPGGLDLLCRFAGLQIIDMWSGWGFIPSVASHALGLGKFKAITYKLQSFFDFLVRLKAGPQAVKVHKYSTSGSFGFFARK